MLIHFELFFCQLLIGVGIGFYFTDKKTGISWRDFRFGMIVLLAVVSFLLFKTEKANLYVILMTATSALVLFGSVLGGEYLHIRLTERVLKRMEKENIHTCLVNFVEQAKKVASHTESEGKEVLDIKLFNTVRELRGAAAQAARLNQKELSSQIEKIANNCVTLCRLSTHITCEEDAAYRQFQTLADALLKISWDTLQHTEQSIRKDMKKSWNTITFAMKTVHMK